MPSRRETGASAPSQGASSEADMAHPVSISHGDDDPEGTAFLEHIAADARSYGEARLVGIGALDCATDRMSLEPVPLVARPGTLAARLNVDSREELVLGPAGEAARLFFADSTCGEATR